MRKTNSNFITAFVSESGADPTNNDYFGFVELDEYACYVIADGLSDLDHAEGARMAIEEVVQKFQEHPSIKKGALQSYLNAANKKLLESKNRRLSLKASITVVVTNYECFRYATAGNTRMYLYRGNSTFICSEDMSLAQRTITEEKTSPDKLTRHEQRNNLYAYLGQKKGFESFVSKKIKLKESDVITLFTRGIWENVDDGELLDVFSEASDDPQQSVDMVEEMLLSRQPADLDNYTIAAIFINKLFQDPNRKKKRKRIIMITVAVILVIIIVIVVLLLINRSRTNKQEDMEEALTNAIGYIENDNYTKALEAAETSYDLAKKLKDKGMQSEIDAYVKLAQAVINADSLLDKGKYQESQDAYLSALDCSVQANNAGKDYINNQLTKTEQYINFFELMDIGDQLAELSKYEAAISLYTEAKSIASNLYFSEGKQQAADAISKAYEDSAEEEASAQEKADAIEAASQESADAILAAADLLTQGDTLYKQGDYEAANTYYQLAKQKYEELKDASGITMAESKISLTESKISANADQEALAAEYLQLADDYYDTQNYSDAKKYYTLARQLYNNLGITWRVTQMDNKIELAQAAYEQELNETDIAA